MLLTDETFQAVIIAAIHVQGGHASIESITKEAVDALIAADRKLVAYKNEGISLTSEAR